MLTALFSVTFTSCIDNEVSPLVEAIYEAQADLIAAQAGVQNAEAALLLAQANAEDAQAAYTASLTAQVNANTAGIIADNAYEAAQRAQWLLELVAETNVAVAEAQHDLQIAQAEFEIEMAELTAEMEAAGANLAVGYAYDYMYAMNVVNNLKAEKLSKQGQLALAELYLKAGTPETTWALYLAGLNTTLAAEQAKVTAAEAAIVTLNTAKANPTAIETQLAALKTQKATLTARQTELVALIALAEQNRLAAQKAVNDATSFMADPAGPYATAKAALTLWKGNYATDTMNVRIETANVALHTNAIANYASTYTTLKGGVNTALGVIGWKPMTTDALVIANPYVGVATSPASGRLKDIADVTAAIGSYGTAPVYADVPRTATAPAVLTAQDKLWNADLALLKFEQDFAALTASYNLAAYNFAVAKAAFDAQDYAGDLAAANLALSTYQAGAFDSAQTAYTTAKTAFEANPNQTVWTDTAVDAWDLGKVGIHTDDDNLDSPFGVTAAANTTKTYYRVATWSQPLPGSWVPATAGTTAYTAATLASFKTAFEIANGGNTAIFVDDLSAAITTAEKDDALLAETANGLRVYFIEVETDDTHNDPILGNGKSGNLDTFDNATNALGTEITAAFYTGTTTRTYASDIAPANTAYKVLWNLQKAVSQAAWNLEIGDDAYLAAKEAFDYQKGLFESGLATRANLEGAVDAAKAVLGKVTTSTPASGLLGDQELLLAKLGSDNFLGKSLSDAKLTTSSTGAFYTVGTVKTLTDYAMLFNARKDFNALVSVSLASHQTMLATAQANLTTATREAAEDLIFIAKYTADLAALQAQYDALIVTPLYAALNVTLVNATQAKAALEAEQTAVGISIGSLTTLITALQGTVPDYTALIAAENAKITTAKAAILATQIAISKGNVDLAALQANVQSLKDQIAVLTIRIANAQAIADKFKALMDAALAS